MDYKNYSEQQLQELKSYALHHDNPNAAIEIADYQKFYGKNVKVVKGRKVPKGITGVVFWLRRQSYSKHGDPWGIYSSTRCGIKTEKNQVYWTDIKNLEVV